MIDGFEHDTSRRFEDSESRPVYKSEWHDDSTLQGNFGHDILPTPDRGP
ncbi:hypothetical protein AB0G04_08825 [Actinoplanes sp. NPDC023801]